MGEAVEPGVSTQAINHIVDEYIRKHCVYSTFKNYNCFPAAACVSVNDEIIHRIPSKTRIIKPCDIVSVDVGSTELRHIGHRVRLLPGMTIAIEPMINLCGAAIKQMPTVGLSKQKMARIRHTLSIQ